MWYLTELVQSQLELNDNTHLLKKKAIVWKFHLQIDKEFQQYDKQMLENKLSMGK